MATPAWFLFISLVILIVAGVLIFYWLKKFTSPRLGRMIGKSIVGASPPRRDSAHDLQGLPWIGGTERSKRWEWLFFLSAVTVYLGSRLFGLLEYPSFFYADEAAHAVIAQEIVDQGGLYDGEFLPTYFYNVDKYSLSVSVYLHCIPAMLGISTPFVTRLVAVLITVGGLLAVGFTLRSVYRSPYWWSAFLLVCIMPAWLLHSRTAFETAAAVSFFAMFFWAYLTYLYESPKFIYPTWFFAALTFYTYNPGRVVITLSGLLLFLSDVRVHWQNRRTILRSLWLPALLGLPYLRFQFTHFLSELDHLELLKSYWVEALPLLDKIWRYIGELLDGLNPTLWFFPNKDHLIWPPVAPFSLTKYGQIHWILLPFVLIGCYLALVRIRRASFRNLLILLIGAPAGAALVEVNSTRALFLIIPVTLLGGIGISWVLGILERRVGRKTLNLVVLVVISALGLEITRAALVHMPTWPEEARARNHYRVAQETYKQIEKMLEENPRRVIVVSPYWSYATSFHARLFAQEIDNILFGRIDEVLLSDLPMHEDVIFVMLADEFARMGSHQAVQSYRVENILLCADRQPCLFFASVKRVEPDNTGTPPVAHGSSIGRW